MATTSTAHASSRLLTLFLTSVCAVAWSAAANAALIYDEAVGGDLGGNQASPRVLGNFLEGVNSVKGLMSLASDATGGQGDGFALSLLSGQKLTSVSVTISNFGGSDPFAARLYRAASVAPNYSFLSYQLFTSLSGDQTLVFNIPAGLTDETVGFSLQRQTSNNPSSFTMNWQWDISVAPPVPEPASIAMLLSGLSLLAIRRRQA